MEDRLNEESGHIFLPHQKCKERWKDCSNDQEIILKFKAKGLELEKNLEITRTIYSSSERSEQFLVTECFFSLFLEISQISKKRTIIIQIGKYYWDLETCRKR